MNKILYFEAAITNRFLPMKLLKLHLFYQNHFSDISVATGFQTIQV